MFYKKTVKIQFEIYFNFIIHTKGDKQKGFVRC